MIQHNLHVISILIYLLSPLAQSWREAGHMIVCQIAKQDLLVSDQDIYYAAEELSYFGGELTRPTYTYDFMYAGVWPDDIKRTGVRQYDDWHFLNLPINNDGLSLNFQHYENNNAVWAIEQFLKTLKRLKSSKTVEKAIALRLLTHILGDLHQPLHASALYNETFKGLSGDEGGNRYHIHDNITGESITKLHQLWDAGIGLLKPIDQQRPINSNQLQYVREFSSELLKKYPRKDLKKELEVSDPQQWALESLQLSKQIVYKPLNGSKEITVEYQEQAFAIVEKQLAVAGYRLADKLREALEDQNFETIQDHKSIKKYLRIAQK